MSETKPLPCPFCGGQLRRNMCGYFEDDNKGCILYGFEIHEKIIPMWNTRKPLERIVERLEETKGYTVAETTLKNHELVWSGVCIPKHDAIAIVKEGA